ncbi:MAG: hypothetical protein LBT14_02075 [Treponema sp.]|jgi:hypothetical protein|nr:hypothetical protein [Treponema sp.]
MKELFWGILRVMMVLAVIVLFGVVVMLLWNWLLPPIAGLPAITFLQAVGLLALSCILFGSLGGMGRMFAGGAMRGRDHGNPFREKWEKMSSEERREFVRKQHLFHSHFFEEHGSDEPSPDKNKE